MENLSKLTLVKRHLEKIKSRSVKLSSFSGHLSGKYSLDAITEKEKHNMLVSGRVPAPSRHS